MNVYRGTGTRSNSNQNATWYINIGATVDPDKCYFKFKTISIESTADWERAICYDISTTQLTIKEYFDTTSAYRYSWQVIEFD